MHESFHHASWSNINFGSITTGEIRNFFFVGSTKSLAFSDNSSMSKTQPFGFISRVDTSSSCLTIPASTEIIVTTDNLDLDETFSYPANPGSEYLVSLTDFGSSYTVNEGERETLDAYLDDDKVQ